MGPCNNQFTIPAIARTISVYTKCTTARASYINKKIISKAEMLISLKKNNKLFNTFTLSFKLENTSATVFKSCINLMGTLRRCVRKSTPNTERADSHKCVFPPHWQMRWHEAHDCISVTVDLTQPLDSERHSQHHSRMCIQIFSQLISYTLFLLTHTYSSVPCFYTLSCGAKHI